MERAVLHMPEWKLTELNSNWWELYIFVCVRCLNDWSLLTRAATNDYFHNSSFYIFFLDYSLIYEMSQKRAQGGILKLRFFQKQMVFNTQW